MSSKNASVCVDFVEDDIFQLTEKTTPLWMIGQNRCMQHVWVRKNKIGFGLDPTTLRRWRISIEDARLDELCDLLTARQQFKLTLQLILCESFGGKQIQRSRIRVVQTTFKNGQVVAERFSTCCAGDHNEIFACTCCLQRPHLVRVKLLDVLSCQKLRQARMQRP